MKYIHQYKINSKISEKAFYLLVSDPVYCLFSFPLFPYIKAFVWKMCAKIITSCWLDFLSTKFSDPILGDSVSKNKQLTGSGINRNNFSAY